METLLEVLTQYAEENLVLRFLAEYAPQIQGAQARAERLDQQLKGLGPDASERVEALRTELDQVCSCREQALLLSGISIGLELGRL